MAVPEIHVGTSGWTYDCFEGSLYAGDTPKRKYLEVYSSVFKTVELNASFYRSFPETTWKGWYRRTPPDFLWAVKGPRYFTHIKRLEVSRESIGRFWHDVAHLREKFGVALFQLPPNLKFDESVFMAFLEKQPLNRKIAIEARNASWHMPHVWSLFEKHGVAWVISHTAKKYPMSLRVTANFTYLRLHGTTELYKGLYGQEGLDYWLDTIIEWGVETFVYFDNTADGSAVSDALNMKSLVQAISTENQRQTG